MNPKVLVLILSYNGKQLLDDSISSYLANDYDNFEVVVIDNGSNDATKEYVEEKWPEVKLLRTEKNLKYSGGFNFGLKYAFEEQKADFVLITNNDVKADKNVIKSCVNVALNNPKVGFVTGKVYYFDNPSVFQSCGKAWHDLYWNVGHIGQGEEDIGQYDKISKIEFCDDIFWLVNKKLYDNTGGYDTEFAFQAEDFEWQVRAKKEGFSIYYAPNAKIWHKESMTIGKLSPLKSYYDFRNPLIVHMKHRKYSEFKAFYRMKRRHLLIVIVRNILKLRFYYAINSLLGFVSAIKWGIKHRKLKLVQIIN